MLERRASFCRSSEHCVPLKYKYLHVTGEVLYRPWCGFHTCTGRFSLVLLTAFAGVLNSWADAPPLLHLVLVRSQCRAPADTMTTHTGGLNSARTGPVAALLRRHNCTRGMIAVSPEGGTRCGDFRPLPAGCKDRPDAPPFGTARAVATHRQLL